MSWKRKDKALVQLAPGDLVTLFDLRRGLNGKRARVIGKSDRDIPEPKWYGDAVWIVRVEGEDHARMVARRQMRKLAGRTAMIYSKEVES